VWSQHPSIIVLDGAMRSRCCCCRRAEAIQISGREDV